MLPRLPFPPPPPPPPPGASKAAKGMHAKIMREYEAMKAKDDEARKWDEAVLVTFGILLTLFAIGMLLFVSYVAGGFKGIFVPIAAFGLIWAAVVQVRKYL